MTKPRWVLLPIAITLVAGSGTAASEAHGNAAASTAARSCAHPRGSTVTQSRRGRLLLIGQAYYGCTKPRGALHLLLSVDTPAQADYSMCSDAYDFDCSTAELGRVVGTFAVLVREHTFDDSSCRYTGAVCQHGSDSHVLVWDLRSGRRLRSYATQYPVPPALLLDARGNTIELAAGAAAGASVLTLRRADGSDAQLDIGSIPRRSVKLRGERVSWTRDGVAHSARI